MDMASNDSSESGARSDQAAATSVQQSPSQELLSPNKNTSQHEHAYHSYYGHNQEHVSQYDDQYIDRIEHHRELQYQQHIQQEIHALNQEGNNELLQPNKSRAFPNMILSLAQKIIPTVIQRLQYQDEIRNQSMIDEEFLGDIAPLGQTTTGPVSDLSSHNLKTTGLDQDQTVTTTPQQQYPDVEMGDPSTYLPESAALLITALSNSAKKGSRRGSNTSCTSLHQFPCLLDETAVDGESEARGISFDNFEKEAEALLRSIQNEDVDDTEGATRANIADGLSSMDDDDSIGGDIVRLSRSIVYLQQDLDNLDLSHFDRFEDEFDEGNSSSAWSRMKLWFSRGMIMEQKLLNTVNGMDDDNYGGGSGADARNRYAENPVLIWSMAIMWAFLLLIMGHSKIAEWVEGEDPGRLVDVIEWIFS
jgi:hypothetical protein